VPLNHPSLTEEQPTGEGEGQKLSLRMQLACRFHHLLRMQADHMNVAVKR